MDFHWRIILLQFFFHLIFLLLLADAQNQALPGCQSRCGNVDIPYPFGIRKGCYMNKEFKILCKASEADSSILVPILANTGHEIIKISLDAEVLVRVPTTTNCYDGKSGKGQGGVYNVFTLPVGGPFVYSSTRNMLTANGCDIVSHISDPVTGENMGGCASICNSNVEHVDLWNGTCSGIGCCQTGIPEGLKSFNLSLGMIINDKMQSWASNSNGCSLAALHAVDQWRANGTVAALDWAIGHESCQDLKGWPDRCYSVYSNCVNSTTGFGHRCQCEEGYQGNPYHPYDQQGGCQVRARSYMGNRTLFNCPSKCGNVSIFYPFGIGGKECYRDEGFEIICNASSVPLLAITGSEIIEITQDEVFIRGPTTSNNCYDSSNNNNNNVFNLPVGPFTLSSRLQNRLITKGCDVVSHISDPKSGNYITGCTSLCDNNETGISDDGWVCSGIGCCQTAIPAAGLKSFNLSLDAINSSTRSINECSFATVHSGDAFNLRLSNSSVSVAALDWAIGNDSCQDVARSKIECAYNGTCAQSSTGFGYVCKCQVGYSGNPYLPDGCQDIDECKEGTHKCIEEAVCRNEDYPSYYGRYSCDCRDGYYGDGLKGGEGYSGCFSLGSSRHKVVIIALGSSMGLLLLVAFSYWLYKKLQARKARKLKQKFFKKNGGLLLEQQICSEEGNVEKTKIFRIEQLEKATDGFNESRILGKGGSGTVYKGMLTDGRIVAIKKSKLVDENQTGQFINELVILSQVNHRHVVKILGCCLETEVPLLVYEYISNGTLSHHLHDDNLESSISWEHRLRISIEVAGALSYLHSSASTPIFHRDVKSCNILLDENYRATVSDFGISKSVSYEKTHLTTLVQGTFGYLDPEYFHSGQFTEKSDVYSFGIVLVELLTGQRAISVIRSEEEKNLAMYFKSSVKQGRLYQILDTPVLKDAEKEEIFVVAKLAKRCLKSVGRKRPTMKEVMIELEGLRRHQEEPRPLIPQNYQQTMNLTDEQTSISITGPQLLNMVEEESSFSMTGHQEDSVLPDHVKLLG